MRRNKYKNMLLRVVSAFLLISLLNQILVPSVAFALTSGPTSPEATSFEPVDTTDMVNPLTGDFVYNLPLLEVPGPEGGYPISLSYHAGLQPNEDSSWAGLGWTINPGAINRNVNGFPDEWYGASSSRRDYWVGGTRTVTNVGLNIPILGNAASVSLGLAFSNDTYDGRKFGWNAGIGFGIPNSPFSVGIGVGVSLESGDFYAYGQVGASAGPFSVALGISTQGPYANAGLELKGGSKGFSISEGLNVSTNFKSLHVDLGAEASYGVLGISMSSNNPSPSLSVAGFSASTANSKQGTISSYTKSVSFNFLIGSYSREKTRYWSDEKEETTIYGGLYQTNYYLGSVPDNYAYDNYSIHDESLSIVDHPDPNKLQGGTLPSYDSYQVTAQGLGGTMRPYAFAGITIAQNRREKVGSDNVQTVRYYSNYLAAIPEFRFDNDFSNNYLQNYLDYPVLNDQLFAWSPPFSGPSPIDVEWWNGSVSGANTLAGSRHINWYVTVSSNGTVHNYDNKFVTPVVAGGLDRRAHTHQSSGNNHIAGFSITNANGVTYHYNLPAYAYDEETYQENMSYSSGDMFNRQVKSEGYAYTWHLTAITGPDYVDRGISGQLDNSDYGYWVSFEYGKWSDKYNWRNPSDGYHIDDDNQFRSVSMGKKEVYYLNAIKTRSHVAIFEKDVKLDGKGASSEIFNKVGDKQYTNDGLFNVNSSQTLRLDKIYLLNASDAAIISSGSGGSSHYIPSGRTVDCTGCELEDNVIDKYDVNAVGRNNLESKAIRIIDFNYDYSLAKGTENSYDINNLSFKNGKLTLKSVQFRGKGGVNLLPKTDFQYELDADESQSFSGLLTTSTFQTSSSAFDVGDLLVDVNTGVFCGVVSAKGGNLGSSAVYVLTNSSYTGASVTASLKATKNPPYNKNHYDIWGMYKADYAFTGNDNLDRMTSPLSNMTSDVWSLRKVVTGLGAEIEINYEGDTYGRTVLNEAKPYTLTNFTHDSGNDYHFTVNNVGSTRLDDVFKVGDNVSLITLLKKTYFGTAYYTTHNTNNSPAPIITAINGNQISIKVSTAQKGVIDNNDSVEGGNVAFSPVNRKYGGGIRVKSIVVDNLFGTRSSTVYGYNLISNGNGSQISSGSTTYEPITLDRYGSSVPGNGVNDFKRGLYQDMNKIYSLSRELPGPGVMYEYVTVETEVFGSPDFQTRKLGGKKTLQFEVFRENMIGKQDVYPPNSAPRSANETYYTRNIALKKFVAGIGALKRIVNYDDKGHKLNETINHYLHDGLEHLKHVDFIKEYETRLISFKKQGLLKERYSEAKSVWTGNGDNWDIKATLTARENFPNIQTGQTVVDYATGVTRSTVNQEFDFYSGTVIKKLSTDSYGNRFVEETIPAYRKYPGMGLKVQDPANKNMLTQETASYTYKVDAANQKVGLVASNVSTWGVDIAVLNNEAVTILQDNPATNGKVWRKKANYSWLPAGESTNGITSIANFTDFNWTSPDLSVDSWIKISENTLFDIFSKPLEDRNMNNLFSTLHMGYNNSKVVASASPSRYDEIAYSGAEDGIPALAHIDIGAGTISDNYAHTGLKSVALPSNGQTLSYTTLLSKLDPVRRDYFISVWVKPSNSVVSTARLYYSIDGQPEVFNNPTFQKFAAGWYLIEMKVPASAISAGSNNITVGCRNLNGGELLYFDDFRFHPSTAGMVSYVYDRFSGELTHVLDNNNLYVKYEYDAAGRLIKVYKEVLGKPSVPKIKEIEYYYRRAGI